MKSQNAFTLVFYVAMIAIIAAIFTFTPTGTQASAVARVNASETEVRYTLLVREVLKTPAAREAVYEASKAAARTDVDSLKAYRFGQLVNDLEDVEEGRPIGSTNEKEDAKYGIVHFDAYGKRIKE